MESESMELNKILERIFPFIVNCCAVMLFSAYSAFDAIKNHENAFKVAFHLEFSGIFDVIQFISISFTLANDIFFHRKSTKNRLTFYDSWILILQEKKKYPKKKLHLNCTRPKWIFYSFSFGFEFTAIFIKVITLNYTSTFFTHQLAHNYQKWNFQ